MTNNLLTATFAAWTCLCSLACPAARAQGSALTLEEAEARMERGNLQIIAARHALDVARSSVALAGAVPNPTLSAQVSNLNPWRGIGAGNFFNKQMDTALRLDQLIERGGKRELRVAGASAEVRAARHDLREVRRQQRLAVHRAYHELKLAQERHEVLQENARLHQQSLEASQRRLAAGDIAAAEVLRIEVETLRAANEAAAALVERTRARQELAVLFGQPAAAGELTAVDEWPLELPAGAAGEVSIEAVSARADVRAAQARVEAAERRRELARSLRTRDLTMGTQVERLPPESGLAFGVSVSFPLFVRYQFQGEIARAEAELTAAIAERERQVLLALSEARLARSAMLAAAERRRRLTEELVRQARRSLESAEFAYSRGATGLLDLLDARRTMRAVEIEAANAQADFAKARSAWLAATAAEAFSGEGGPAL